MSQPTYFAWKDKAMIKVDPEDAYFFIKEIEEKTGACTAQALVNASKPKRSLLHNEFEWDDKTAANEWRKSKARSIMHSLMVQYPETGEVVTRAFEVVQVQNKTGKTENGYVNSYDALNDPVMRDQVLKRVVSELNAFRHRYKTLNEVSKVIQVIDETIAALG